MTKLTKDFFIGLSKNRLLNESAKKWGFRLGANKFIAGTELDSVVDVIKELNESGISCTLDHLGEFVSEKEEAIQAKNQILLTLDRIFTENLDCHLSVKLTQLGLDISDEFCTEQIMEIVERAFYYNLFVNIDMEDYTHYEQTLNILKKIRVRYDNVGTVIQSYLYRSRDDVEELKNVRLRIVKGAYKESSDVAYQSKEKIDKEFLALAKTRLLDGTFTSIATHDHRIIYELMEFVEENGISKEVFEFQMLYGFRTEMQYELANAGYNFCTYIPFGTDWFGYFMRRLAERPQNIHLIMKDVFDRKNYTLKKPTIITGMFAMICWMIWRNKRRKSC